MNNAIPILGSGLNGLLMSLALANNKISSIVMDKNINSSKSNDNRNISITISSKDFFESIGIWQEISKYTSEVRDIYVVDNSDPKMLHFEGNGFANGVLGFMIPYKDLMSLMFDLCKNNSLINFDTSEFDLVQDIYDNFQLSIDDKSTSNTNDVIVNCQGSSSYFRKFFPNFDFIKDYKQNALVFNISHQNEHEGTAIEHFTYNGVFASLPLKSQFESSIVWSLKNNLADVYLKMYSENKSEFCYFLRQSLGQQLGEIQIISDIGNYQIMGQITSNYYNKNLVLVGDVAHTIHPLAGQGFNQGVKDIKVLTEIISDSRKSSSKLSEIDFKNYQKQRKSDNIRMFLFIDYLDKTFTNTSTVVSLLRKLGINTLNKFEFLKKRIIYNKSKPRI